MNTRKRLFVGLLVLAIIMTLAIGIVGCKHPEPDPEPQFTPQGEEAVYYVDSNGSEYTVELKQGNFTLSIAGDNKSGTYTFDKTSKEVVLTFAEQTIRAQLNLAKGEFEIRYNGVNYLLIKKVNYTVVFNVNGGSAIASATVVNGKYLQRPADPTKEGHVFAGWYVDPEMTVAFNFKTQKITGNMTLYARYAEMTDGANEFSVKLVNNGQVVETRATLDGVLVNLPDLTEEGKTFLGWWMSDSNDGARLSRQYVDQVIEQNTSLFAVWAGDLPSVSISENKIWWNDVGTERYTYLVRSVKTGETVVSGTTTSTSVDIDLSNAKAGEYEVTVTVDGESATAYMNYKMLAQVSLFVVDGNDLIFNKVAHAENYLITFVCGDPAHVHENESLNGSSVFNFANCQIDIDGYKFTITAVAEEGYVDSVSETFVYNRTLGNVTNILRDSATEVVTWDKVENASYYVVKIISNNNVEKKTVYTESIFLGDYRGDITVEITPVAFGYNSTAQSLSYMNSKLATPSNVRISGNVLSWDAVDGATEYLVRIGDKEFTVTSTTLTLTEEHFDGNISSYAIQVKAICPNAADNSLYSAEFTVKYGQMGDKLTYENNVLSWDAVLGSVKYVVTVNPGEETETVMEITDGSIFATIVWPRAGENIVSVYSVDKDGNKSASISTKVFTYEIRFEAGEGNLPVASIFKAVGDEYELPEATSVGVYFSGWYDSADYENGKRYEDVGIFTEGKTVVLYAGWTSEKYFVTLDLAGEGTLGDASNQVEVIYGRDYQTPVPTTDKTNLVFAGWYTEPNGAGNRYVDEKGNSVRKYPQASSRTLYAHWVEIFQFAVVYNPITAQYDSVTVSAGRGVIYATEITIPVRYYGELEYVKHYKDNMGNDKTEVVVETKDWKVREIAANAFRGCSSLVQINIPDTIESIAWGGNGSYEEGSIVASSSRIQTIRVYKSGHPEIEAGRDGGTQYWSENGVLYVNDIVTGEVEVHLYPYAKTDAIYKIPYGVTNIPQYTFRATKFVQVMLPSSVKTINQLAFYNCAYLDTITFMEPQDGETAGEVLSLSGGDDKTLAAIYGCTNLTTIVFPTRLSFFNMQCLAFVDNLSTILIGSTDNAVGQYYASVVFKDASGNVEGSMVTDKTKSTLIYIPRGYKGSPIYNDEGAVVGRRLIIPNGITTIASNSVGSDASDNACEFTHIVIPGTVKAIEPYAFANCRYITDIQFEGTVDDPNLTIRSFAFAYCTGLREITLPANLVNMFVFAFAYTSSLTTVRVEADREGVNYEAGAFACPSGTGAGYGTYYVSVIYLGKNVPEIAISAVFGNVNITSIVVDPENPNYKDDGEGVLFNKNGTRILFFPMGKGGSYTIPAEVTEIYEETFRDRDLLEEIVIHSGITLIGSNAFYGCDKLSSVVFGKTPNGTVSVSLEIGAGAFYECKALTSISIPARVVYIGSQAFRGCTYLAEIEFLSVQNGEEERELVIDELAFYYCGTAFDAPKHLTSIVLPDRLVELGNMAFLYASYLESINIPKNLVKMGYYVEQNVYVRGVDSEGNPTQSNLTKKDVLVSMSVFYGCSRLKNINVDPANKYFVSIDGILYGKEYQAVTVTDYRPFITEDRLNYSILDEYYYDNTDGTAKVLLLCPAGHTGVNGKVTIPNTIMAIWFNAFANNGNIDGGAGITEIDFSKGYIENARDNTLEVGNNVFYYTVKLKTITLPRGIRTITQNMFYYCQALESITIPSSVESIAQQAFYRCTSLKTVNFETTPAEQETVALVFEAGTTGIFVFCDALTNLTLPERTTIIGAYAFKGSKLLEIQLPSTLQVIENNAFANLNTLNKVTFPNGLKEGVTLQIWDNAFYNDSYLNVVQLPEGVTDIGANAFAACINLVEISLPASLATLGQSFIAGNIGSVFSNASSLTTVIFAKDIQLAEIPKYTFAYTALTSIEIPASVTEIGQYAFYSCYSLSTVTFAKDADGNNSLESIESYAFARAGLTRFDFPDSTATTMTLGSNLFDLCDKLTEVYLCRNINDITGVFKNCTNIEKVTVSSENPNFKTYEKDGVQLPILVSLNDESIKFVYSVLKGEFEIPEGFLFVENGAFKDQAELTRVVLPTTLISIGDEAFYNCTSLAEVYVKPNNTLTSIGASAFANTIALTSFTVPSHEEFAIGASAFINSGLKTLVFGAKIASVGSNAFANTTALTEVTLPDCSTMAVGDYAFKGSGIKTFTFAGAVASVGAGLFYGCADLTTINNWPAVMVKIPDYTFCGCSSLTAFTIPEHVNELGQYAFSATGITSITIPDTITKWGHYMFYGATKLANITFETNDDITNLGYCAFMGCVALTSIDLTPLNGLTILGYYTFSGTGITEFTVPNAVIDLQYNTNERPLDSYLFYNATKLEKITWHDGIRNIGHYTFYGCTSLKTMVVPSRHVDEDFTGAELPANLVNIGQYAFYGCTALTSFSNSANADANKLVCISNYAFSNSGIDKFIVNPACKTWGTQVFAAAANLKQVEVMPGNALKAFPDKTFLNCKKLESINIENFDSMNYLGKETFNGCSSLKSIKMPPKLKVIGTSATAVSATSTNLRVFYNCTSLETVDLQNVTKIGRQVFYGCSKLATVVGLDNCELLGTQTFYGCGFTELEFGSKMANNGYGTGVFSNCKKLERVIINNGPADHFGVTGESFSAANGIFGYCSKLSDVTIYDNIKYITVDAFYGCTSLTDASFLEGAKNSLEYIYPYAFQASGIKTADLSKLTNLREIKQYAFNKCTDLTTIALPEGLTKVYTNAFSDCKKVSSISLPSTLTIVGEEAFLNCAEVTTFTIPANLREIGANAFGGFKKLNSYNVDPSNSNYRVGKFGELIQVYEGQANVLVNLPYTFVGTYEVENGLTLGPQCFANVPGLTEVILPDDITEIPDQAFYYSYITHIDIPFTVTRIGNQAFASSKLEEIMIPYSVVEIGVAAFASTQLTTLTIPETVERLGKQPIQNCKLITKLEITNPDVIFIDMDGNETPDWWLIYGNDKIEHLILPEGIKKLGTAFIASMSAGNLTFNVPSSVTEIKSALFSMVKGGTYNITLPDTITSIPGGCFAATAKVVFEYFRMPDSLVSIGGTAFKYVQFGTLDWGNSQVLEIGNNTFQYATFDEISIPESVVSIGYESFMNAKANKLVVPANVTFGATYVSSKVEYWRDSTFKNANIGELVFAEGRTSLGVGVNKTGYGMFNGATIGKIVMPSTLEVLGDWLFENIKSLTNLEFKHGLMEIGSNTFNKAKITNLYLPASVLVFGDTTTFSGWTASQTIYFRMTEAIAMQRAFDVINSCNATKVFDYQDPVPEA